MFINIEDFNIDFFLELDDNNIKVYYNDLESIPNLANIVPLGSFNTEGELLLKAMPIKDRITTGIEFLLRDGYAEYNQGLEQPVIRADLFIEEFKEIPEVVSFFEKYIDEYGPSIPMDAFLSINEPAINRFTSDIDTNILVNALSNFIQVDVISSGGQTATSRVPYAVNNPVFEPGTASININHIVETSSKRPVIYGTAFNIQGDIFINMQGNTYNITPELSGYWQFMPSFDFNEGFNLVEAWSTSSVDGSIIRQNDAFNVFPNKSGVINPGSISIGNQLLFGLLSKAELELSIQVAGRTLVVQADSDGYWRTDLGLTAPGNYTVDVTTTSDIDGTQITESIDILVQAEPVINIVPFNSGYLMQDDINSPVIISGNTLLVPNNQGVSIIFDGTEYQTTSVNGSFSVEIPASALSNLTPKSLHVVEVITTGDSGVIGQAYECLYTDTPIHDLTIITELELDFNNWTQVIGEVKGDINSGDQVTITADTTVTSTTIFQDTKYPGDNKGYTINYTDIYFVVVVYFNGLYRTKAKHAQDFGTYTLLSDINFDWNKYSLVINIKEFFTSQFINFLKTVPGSIPFSNEYGTTIKNTVQTKNFIVRQLEVDSEINRFISNFNDIYGGLVEVKNIELTNETTDIGADIWVINVFASIQKDRLVYRLEI